MAEREAAVAEALEDFPVEGEDSEGEDLPAAGN